MQSKNSFCVYRAHLVSTLKTLLSHERIIALLCVCHWLKGFETLTFLLLFKFAGCWNHCEPIFSQFPPLKSLPVSFPVILNIFYTVATLGIIKHHIEQEHYVNNAF